MDPDQTAPSGELTLKMTASENVVCLSHLLHIFANII